MAELTETTDTPVDPWLRDMSRAELQQQFDTIMDRGHNRQLAALKVVLGVLAVMGPHESVELAVSCCAAVVEEQHKWLKEQAHG